jgi:polyisoprenoid-binding protein YceI
MTSRFLPSIALLSVLSIAGWAASDEPLTFVRGGTITIEGTSNVHGWDCTTTQFTGNANGALAETGITGMSALTVSIPVAQIDCDNGTMNTKLRQALRASAAPNIRFVLGNATVSGARANRFTVNTSGQLTIAGQTRPVTFTAQGQVLANNRYRFTGSVPVTMSQFGIRPPTAMMGTMRTGDRVTVRFDVTLAR